MVDSTMHCSSSRGRLRSAVRPSLGAALGLGERELVALVGSGGKTSALIALARGLASGGKTVTVTTTTAMYLHELARAGRVLQEADEHEMAARIRDAVTSGFAVGVARLQTPDGKVIGLSPSTVDALWGEGIADYLIVEADGSRGRSLKAFARHEPQVPGNATVIVQVVGLDVVGMPLTEQNVHRAAELAGLLGLPVGVDVTTDTVARTLREQLRRLRAAWPESRVITLLNKADEPGSEAQGVDVARELLAETGGSPRAGRATGALCPDVIVMASLREGRYRRLADAEG